MFPSESPDDPVAQRALHKLEERGSLDMLSPAGRAHLTPQIAKWLYWAESHQGSELVYQSESGLFKALPLNSFYDFPERYEAQIQQGAFLSLELEDGHSRVLWLAPCTRADIARSVETVRQTLPPASERPLQERMLEKMRQDGHLGFLSKEGMQHLSLKLLKYLDYAVSIRPGSEVIYRTTNGFIHGDTLDKLLARPELFAEVPKPLYLTIETGAISVIFDTADHQPETIHRLIRKAEQMAAGRLNPDSAG